MKTFTIARVSIKKVLETYSVTADNEKEAMERFIQDGKTPFTYDPTNIVEFIGEETLDCLEEGFPHIV